MAKQSLFQITLLQIVKLCVPSFFFPLAFYLQCIPLFQVQTNRKHTSAAFFLKRFSYNSSSSFFLVTFITDPFSLSMRGRVLQQLALLEHSSPCSPTAKKGLHRNVGSVWIKGAVQKLTGWFIVGIAGGLLVLSDEFWKDISTLNRQFSYFHIQAPATFSYLLNLILSHSVCLFVCLPLNYSQEKLKLFI